MSYALEVINRALVATGNNPVEAIEDRSPEWMAASVAHDRALSEILARHSWAFAQATAVLTASADNPSPDHTNAWHLPPDSLHLQAIRRLTGTSGQSAPVLYRIFGRLVCCDETVAPTAIYVRQPSRTEWATLFVEALTLKVEAHLLRSLNEDEGAARSRIAEAELMLQEARTATDQEEPRRAMYVGRLREARRNRRGPTLR